MYLQEHFFSTSLIYAKFYLTEHRQGGLPCNYSFHSLASGRIYEMTFFFSLSIVCGLSQTRKLRAVHESICIQTKLLSDAACGLETALAPLC